VGGKSLLNAKRRVTASGEQGEMRADPELGAGHCVDAVPREASAQGTAGDGKRGWWQRLCLVPPPYAWEGKTLNSFPKGSKSGVVSNVGFVFSLNLRTQNV